MRKAMILDYKRARVLGQLIIVLLMTACSSTASPPSSGSVPASPATPAVSSGTEVSPAGSASSPGSNVSQIKFRRLGLEDGLSQSTVSCIEQDDRGFMWFSTQDGLNRYDGYEFKVYRHDPDDPYSLSNNRIQLCHKDQRGVLWFVTFDSVLHRHDPLTDRFYRYPLEVEDPHSRRGVNILTMYGDSSGQLWIGTYGGGLAKYDPNADQLVYYRDDLDDPARQSEHDNKVYTILEDRAGILWFGTGEGLVSYDAAIGRFVLYPYEPQGYAGPHDTHSLRSQFVTIIHEDRAGRLWIGTVYGGLNRLDRETGEFIAYPFDPDEPAALSGNTVRALHEDRFGQLWVSSAELTPAGTYARLGLDRLDPETGKIVHYPPDPTDPCSLSHESVPLIHEDTQGNLWFHTFRGGVDVYDWDIGCFRHYVHNPDNPESLSNDAVATFFNDAAGGVWVGTEAGGVNLYDPTWTKFSHYLVTAPGAERGSNNSIFGLYAPPSGIDDQGHANVLWVSTTAGLNRWDRRNGTFTFYEIDREIPDVVPYAMLEEPAGTLWLGTGLGLYKAILPADGAPDPETLEFTLILSRDRVGRIMGIHPDRTGALWLGVYDVGLARFDPVTEELVYYKHDPENRNSLASNAVRDLFPGHQGTLWIHTASGLDRFDPATETFTRYAHDPEDPQSLSAEVIIAVYDAGDAVWIGTSGDGMQRLDPVSGTFATYHEEAGLPNNVIYAILPDGEGNLWLSTNYGVSRFNPQRGTAHNYTQHDGLQSNEFNWKAHYLAPDGEMFLGGVKGINAFYPSDIHDNPHAPSVFITGLQILNEPVEMKQDGILQRPIESTDAIELSYADRVVSFEFAGLHYAAPERNQYAYMLEGFDEDWNYIGNRRFATYTNLPPGAYSFHVKVCNSDGVWNEVGRSLAVTVVPPFWDTWWFRFLIALALLGAVAGGIRLRIRSIEARSRELEAVVEERTHALVQRTEEIERRRQELEALQETTAAVASTLELDRLLHRIVQQATTLLQAEGGILNLIDWTRHEDEAVACTGIATPLAGAHSRLDASFSGWVALHNQPSISNQVPEDSRLDRRALEWVAKEQVQSAAAAPLTVKDQVVGTLIVLDKQGGEGQFDQADLDLLVAFASQ
ncbi:MAG: two-component regulator propeller domain-containing protein, partial [Anaerolineae bacterium]